MNSPTASLRVGCALWALLCLGVAGEMRRAAAQEAETAPSGGSDPVRVEPHSEWAEAILYFVVVDRFADGDKSNDRQVDDTAKGAFHGGDLVGLTQRLDDLAELGITALWITPVVKNIDGFVTGAGFPDWAYHGYWADDFRQVDPRFGSEAELAQLVAEAHRRGIAVLLDVVYNHVGYNSRYLTDPATRDWLRREDRGTCGTDDLTSCLAGLPDLKTERPEVAEYLFEAHLGLAERTGLDGFRLDTVKHVSHEFWREHRRRVRERLGDDFFLLGEVWGGDAQVLDPWFEGDELDAGFDFGFKGSTEAFVEGRGRTVAFNAYLERRRNPREGHHLAHFLSSHDVPGALWELGGDLDRFRLAVLLQFTSRGIPTVYYGEEVGREGGDWPENRSDMPWGDLGIGPGAGLARNEGLREEYRRLIAIRRARPALWRGSHRGLDFGDDHLVFLRHDEMSGDAVLVAVNRAGQPAPLDVELPAELTEEALEDLWGGAEVSVVEGRVKATIPPLGALIVGARTARQVAPAQSPEGEAAGAADPRG